MSGNEKWLGYILTFASMSAAFLGGVITGRQAECAYRDKEEKNRER